MAIPFIGSNKTVTFYVGSAVYQASASTANFEAVMAELKKADPDTDLLIRLVTPAQAIIDAIAAVPADSPDYLPAGKVSVTISEIRYDGVPVTGVLVDRILAMLAEGFDIMPMVRFMENLFRNPADHAREELYLWLESAALPITEDGYFLAYKTVRSNFTSHHDGVTDNTPGTIVSMPRQEVDPVRDRTCSRGLHFCSKDYLTDGPMARGTVVLLKINPADVVSIPSDYNNTKGRAWQYEVLEVVDHDPMQKVWPQVTSAVGSDYVAPDYDSDEEYDGDGTDWALEIPSDLAGKLFATYRNADLDRGERLDHASNYLGYPVYTFHDLTKTEAESLIAALEAEMGLTTDLMEQQANDEATRIHDLGIIELRREASQAGLAGAWKGYSAKELRDYLLARI
jgi:hypothetical protein